MSGRHLQAIKVEVIPSLSGMAMVRSMLDAAGAKLGTVALHLVGARLEISTGDSQVLVENRSCTVSDELLGRPGRFLINDTVFHVTTSEMSLVAQRCARNLDAGYRPVLLVPESDLPLAIGYAAMWDIRPRITLSSIEQFVGLQIEESSGFNGRGIDAAVRKLIETYNTRVAAVETDPSLLIEIPENLS